MYTPGNPPSALKHKLVSSTITGPFTCSAASLHFATDTSSGSPWSSGKSIFWEMRLNGKESPRIEITSSSLYEEYSLSDIVWTKMTLWAYFFLFPVTKVIDNLSIGSVRGRLLSMVNERWYLYWFVTLTQDLGNERQATALIVNKDKIGKARRCMQMNGNDAFTQFSRQFCTIPPG